MNVVGKVGSLISQGVYSVATPFHPFGGAVDIIVVQQQDGTFRSTPWYVRFGKFQGVLKGAEKIVRISVNGVEADFHMYLDNSGEAYFIREVDPDKESKSEEFLKEPDSSGTPTQNESNNEDRHTHFVDNFRLEHTVSDSGAMQLSVSSVVGRMERSESDCDRRFYDFQEEQPEDSIDLSEYGSNRYESLDGESPSESQVSNSEVVLVSVDGHILTAPLSASEKNAEDVQLDTPQFHLGPGEGAEFCEGSEDFASGESTWAAGYMGELKASTVNVASDNLDAINNEPKDSSNGLQVCEGDGEHVCQEELTKIVLEQEVNNNLQSNSPDTLGRNRQEEVFKSCLELPGLEAHDGTVESDYIVSPSDVQCKKKTLVSLAADDETENSMGIEIKSSKEESPSFVVDNTCGNPGIRHDPDSADILETEHRGSINKSDHCYSFPEPENEQLGTSEAVETLENGNETPQSEVGNDETVMAEEPSAALSEVQTPSRSRFEISLCRNDLHAGMGLAAATEVFDAHCVSAEEFLGSMSSIVTNENLVVRYAEKYLTWDKAAPIVLGASVFGLDLPIESIDTIPVEQEETVKSVENDADATSTSTSHRWRLWPMPFRRVKTVQHENSSSSSEDVFVDSECSSQHSHAGPAVSPQLEKSYQKQLVRTNVPTNEQIASLNLQDGQNMITFSFSTRVLGKQQVDAHIYLWKWNARIVISDVDGTITKSDVLGQFMPLVGKDWTQSGVARLFSAIKENGYQLLFLSARAIVQAYLTRSFLLNLKQDGKALPSGPVVISPDGLFPSLYREVIRRAPHEFKIACLQDIRALFPSDYNPFYAGFGNRDTDELSYRKMGIPKGKIFIINPKGEVAISHRIDVRSYTSLHTLANDMFPPTSLIEQEDYNSWNYWRTPLPEIDI